MPTSQNKSKQTQITK